MSLRSGGPAIQPVPRASIALGFFEPAEATVHGGLLLVDTDAAHRRIVP